MKHIKASFKIYLNNGEFSIMYSELNDGRFTKTFLKDNRITSDFIKQSEYIYALAYLAVNGKPLYPSIGL